MTELFIPDNIFARMLFSKFGEELKHITKFKPSASLAVELRENESAIAFIPTTDIITNKEFFISRNIGISFEGPLSNAFIYYDSGKSESIKEIKLAGDVSTIEVILSKILFKEMYNSDTQISLSTTELLSGTNYILTGDENFFDNNFEKGISFAEQIVELISAPFVHYVLPRGMNHY
jgi:hypothetical protein